MRFALVWEYSLALENGQEIVFVEMHWMGAAKQVDAGCKCHRKPAGLPLTNCNGELIKQ